jgi:hypothetical protein
MCLPFGVFHSVIQERGVRLPSGFPLEVEVPGDHFLSCVVIDIVVIVCLSSIIV